MKKNLTLLFLLFASKLVYSPNSTISAANLVTVTWTGTADSLTPPPGITVSGLETGSITIDGTPTQVGVFTYTITTIGDDDTCEPHTITGTITVIAITDCNFAPPLFGGSTTGIPFGQLGTVTWGNTTNTDINATTGTGQVTVVSREGSVPPTVATGAAANNTQTWSGAVFAQGCAKGNATNNNAFNGGTPGNFNADCRQSLHTFNVSRDDRAIIGDFFSWCAVVRFADVLCPAPWRVPTSDDFRVLHWILTGHPTISPPGSPGIVLANNPYTGVAGTNAAPQIGGAWGGARFTGWAGNLAIEDSRYWSSTEHNATLARRLGFTAGNVWPGYNANKTAGFALRCVR